MFFNFNKNKEIAEIEMFHNLLMLEKCLQFIAVLKKPVKFYLLINNPQIIKN